eukprot:scaffold639920_cov22-Prasinocladus_malaysianus.AAC.1
MPLPLHAPLGRSFVKLFTCDLFMQAAKRLSVVCIICESVAAVATSQRSRDSATETSRTERQIFHAPVVACKVFQCIQAGLTGGQMIGMLGSEGQENLFRLYG